MAHGFNSMIKCENDFNNLSSVQTDLINHSSSYIKNNNTINMNNNNLTSQTGVHRSTIITNNNNNNNNNPKMGSRRIFTPQFKLQVLESYRNDSDCKGNQRATARKYGIHRRQIQKWLQCETNLRSSVANLNQNNLKHQFHNHQISIVSSSLINQQSRQTYKTNNNNNNIIDINNRKNITLLSPRSQKTTIIDKSNGITKLTTTNCIDDNKNDIKNHIQTNNFSLNQQNNNNLLLNITNVPIISSVTLSTPSNTSTTISMGSSPQIIQNHENQHLIIPSSSSSCQPIITNIGNNNCQSTITTNDSNCSYQQLTSNCCNLQNNNTWNCYNTPIDLSINTKPKNYMINNLINEQKSLIKLENLSEYNENIKNNYENLTNIKVFDNIINDCIEAVDLTCRKRKLTSDNYLNNKVQTISNDNSLIKEENQIKNELPAKPVKLFKPYLLDQNDINYKKSKTDEQHDPIIWSNHPSCLNTIKTYDSHNNNNINNNNNNNNNNYQITNDILYPFQSISPTFQSSTYIYERTSPLLGTISSELYWCPKGSPVSGYDSSSSTYSDNSIECYRTTTNKNNIEQYPNIYSIDLKMQSIDTCYYNDLITCHKNQNDVHTWLNRDSNIRQGIALYV